MTPAPSISGIFRFLIAIIVIQLLTAIIVLAALNWLLDPQFIAVVVLFSLIMAVLAAFWFVYIARICIKMNCRKCRSCMRLSGNESC